MSTLLGFAPFILFAILNGILPVAAALAVAALVAAGLAAYGRVAHGRSLKSLEIGSVVLFGGLALATYLWALVWSTREIHLAVDLGMLAIVVVSLVVRRPFTIQYAREQVPAEYWSSPRFLRVNDVITAGWAVAFAVLAVADWVLVAWPQLPPWAGVVVTVVVLVGAIRFTQAMSSRAG